ncbi:ferritin-like domain-containing protein [Mucilaginibacter sabulilitoris]|uniref:Ferritin-like domain-containing protein n=1 Tax=Mucilaginibacter sabulilitoris TaxID=1173583 RepID=A0ABZ0TLG8_9SPHI|nr:ferritin-like domain-containing protein [Mucilaginibacter sabulilitoris]WPU94019.1 ferritin-like domain-containing protein [Mucilaginibacter sabulilitoris]
MKTESQESISDANMARRSFLRYAGVGVASIGLLATAACHKDHQVTPTPNGVDLGAKNDFAILNYAYALEQLEAAFYLQVAATPFSGITTAETKLLTDIRDHEVLHREFFKAALGAKAIPDLTPDFSSIDFSSRAKVLAAAKAFEDTGVTAYDGAGYLIESPDYLLIAGKIVSVEARHAALISNMITPGSFAGADVIDTSNSLNKSATIAEVLKIANGFLKTKVSAINYGYVAS